MTTTQANFGSIVLGGTTSQLLLGNGSTIPTTTYPTITANTFIANFSGSAGGSSTTVPVTINYRLISDGTNKIVFLRIPTFNVTQGTTVQNFIGAVAGLPAALRPSSGSAQLTVSILNNSVGLIGNIDIGSNGNMNVFRSDGANLVAGQQMGMAGNNCIQYFV